MSKSTNIADHIEIGLIQLNWYHHRKFSFIPSYIGLIGSVIVGIIIIFKTVFSFHLCLGELSDQSLDLDKQQTLIGCILVYQVNLILHSLVVIGY